MSNRALITAAAFGAAFIFTAATMALAGSPSCPKWGCGENGPSLNGIWENGAMYNGDWQNGSTMQGTSYQGRYLNGRFLNGFGPEGAVVIAVTLPSGETVYLP